MRDQLDGTATKRRVCRQMNQTDKALLDLATKMHEPVVRQLTIFLEESFEN